ncbi:PREDICTED: FIT family protein CG10671-like [Amphimedon queenslandica]|uniref:FIT family protein n=1 Tax=Amphimedon queenslandica TaxID=400682 RepID=A0A1X7VVS5_AMPQE|nr:PREDICTED: FIT family protein CG10671-like [Amphimedon queenslandica]|eukprot:XP_011402503.1 PREDICTED: FIT family protein CG10671-like [Amphimedon queenslandica]
MASIVRPCLNTLLYSSPFLKAALFSLIVFAFSFYSELYELGEADGPSKDFPLNRYYVKYNWAWTLLFLLPTVSLTAILYTGMELKDAIRHLFRLLINHLIWYSVTQLFLSYQRSVGACSNKSISNRSDCLSGGGTWSDIDISGHVFLLSFSTMIISEEVMAISPWACSNYRILPPQPKWKATILPVIYSHTLSSFTVVLFEIIAAIEIILNVLMILITCLYFHTFYEKILALIISLTLWYVSYHVLYGSRKWLPCTVCEGKLNPLRSASSK